MRQLNFGTLNVNGLTKIQHNDGSQSLNLSNILSDINKNKIDAIGIQESHLGEVEYLQKEPGYLCYFVNDAKNRHHGTGIVIRENYNPTFKRISARVCTATFTHDKKHFLFISGYAPHETLANKFPEQRELFYNDLQKALLQKTSSTIIIAALDANAKTSYNPEVHPQVLGPSTKGNATNNNGKCLIHFAAENNLYLTNTKFKHKMSHRSTWTAPFRPLKTRNGETRRNPIRNQIDYVLTNQRYLQFVTDSRSYNNLKAETDHNMVMMNMRLQLSKLNKPKKATTPKINVENFKKPGNIEKYRIQNESQEKECTSNNERWTKVIETCTEAGKTVLGEKENKKKIKDDKIISDLKERRQILKTKIDGTKSKETREKMERERKNIKKEIQRQLKIKEEKEIDQKMEHLENLKDDNTKYFHVMREIQNMNRNTKTSII